MRLAEGMAMGVGVLLGLIVVAMLIEAAIGALERGRRRRNEGEL